MTQRFSVAITDFIPADDALTPEREVLGDLAEVKALYAMSDKELIGQVESVDCLMVYHFLTVPRCVIERLERCRLIVRCGVGFDAVDIVAARENGIDVCNIPDYGTEDVADFGDGVLAFVD